MSDQKKIRIFVGHFWKPSEAYEKLIQMLDSHSDINYLNYSQPNKDPGASRRSETLKAEIRNAQLILMLSDGYKDGKKWIDFQIEFAQSMGKKFIGIRSQSGGVLPEMIQDASHAIIDFESEKLLETILDLVDK